jgi:RNA polymerase II C-terminal domain phosphatase-like 3/4
MKANPGASDGAVSPCPPHPRFVSGLCFMCGAKEEELAAGYVHVDPRRPASDRKTIPRASDLGTLLRTRKLTLVLDLDHTLLNSTAPSDLSLVEQGHGITRDTRDDPGKGLFRLGSGPLSMLTKLRPFVREFLEKASAMFEMYVYTLGDREYARAAAKLLDPDGAYFGQRIVSSDDSTRSDRKNLDVIPGADPVAVVILDDTDTVWPEHQDNLLLMDRYIYFASSCRNFGYTANSLAEMRRDEREYDGTLAVVLNVLKRVHQGFFDESVLGGRFSDVRQVIRAVRREVLSGCKVAFSRVIPLEVCAEDHRMWRLTEQLGAVCTTDVDETVTHVVARDPGTEKARWAQKNNKFLVNPNWIRAASFRWCRLNEQEFPVTRRCAVTR